MKHIEACIAIRDLDKTYSQRRAGALPEEGSLSWFKLGTELSDDELLRKFLINALVVYARAKNPENDGKFEEELKNYNERLKKVFPL